MKKFKAFLTVTLLSSTLLAVTACTTAPIQPENPNPSREHTLCVQRCVDQLKQCKTQYNKIYTQCAFNAKRQARQDYKHYVAHQLNKNKHIDRSLDSFLDLSDCTNQLSCQSDYKKCRRVCEQ